jgi:hypothetical protein
MAKTLADLVPALECFTVGSLAANISRDGTADVRRLCRKFAPPGLHERRPLTPWLVEDSVHSQSQGDGPVIVLVGVVIYAEHSWGGLP